jgi:hypothetical protein
MKFVCMGLAAVNMVAFHFGPYKSVAQWDQGVRLPGSARLAGAASIALWVGVVFFGRWVGFET